MSKWKFASIPGLNPLNFAKMSCSLFGWSGTFQQNHFDQIMPIHPNEKSFLHGYIRSHETLLIKEFLAPRWNLCQNQREMHLYWDINWHCQMKQTSFIHPEQLIHFPGWNRHCPLSCRGRSLPLPAIARTQSCEEHSGHTSINRGTSSFPASRGTPKQSSFLCNQGNPGRCSQGFRTRPLKPQEHLSRAAGEYGQLQTACVLPP